MLYDRDANTLTLDYHTCFCGDGTQSGYSRCTVCGGTGKGKRGKMGGCKRCYGRGSEVNHAIRIPCATCNGTTLVKDDWCSNIPQEACVFLAENITITRQARVNNWNENYLGLGSLWTVQDYGAAWSGDDDKLKEKVASEILRGHVQAVKVVPVEEGLRSRMCDGIVVRVRQDGYSVQMKEAS